jgi:hypothetical protein
MMVRGHVVSDNANRQQQMDKRETGRETSHQELKEKH